MNLKQYLETLPYGSKTKVAEKMGITLTWLGLLVRKARKPSPLLAKKIEKVTKGAVTARELRPDLFK